MPENIVGAKAKELQAELKKMPRIAKDLGVSFFKSRFAAQGWLDKNFEKWPARKQKDKKRPGRNILMDRGRLRNSITGKVSGDTIVFNSSVPYAKIHNEGGTITKHSRTETFVRNRYTKGAKGKMFGGKGAFKKGVSAGRGQTYKAHTINMPKRQFMGDSAHLRKVIERKIQTTVTKVFK